jgi:serine/threonine-protein kinase
VIGTRINNYQVVSLLGEGGMGSVYLAEHPFMGRKAAIKVLHQEHAASRSLVERFMNEARAANAIGHPNIIDIIDVGLLPSGIPYLMMEFLDGESLAARIARGSPLPIAQALEVAVQVAAGLAAAHDKGIVHRDLKPDNLFLISDRGSSMGRVKILDFGIAKLRGDLSAGGAKTKSGSILGTPPYMSPEQCRGISDDVDLRTDIYALGIILYEMVTGAPPFVSEGWGDVLHMHIATAPRPPREQNPVIPPEMEAAILKALAKRPEDRWSSMGAFEQALHALAPAAAALGTQGAGTFRGPRVSALTPGTPTPGGTAILGVASAAGETVVAGAQSRPVASVSPSAAHGQVKADPAPVARDARRREAVGGTVLTPNTTLRFATGEAAEDPDADPPRRRGGRGVRIAVPIAVGVVAAGIIIVAVGQRGGHQVTSSVPPVSAAAPRSPPPASQLQPAAPLTPAEVPTAPVLAPPRAPAPIPATPPLLEPDRQQLPTVHGAQEVSHAPKKVKVIAIPKKATNQPASKPPSKPGCEPNFFFDAQGDKHFKPECF